MLRALEGIKTQSEIKGKSNPSLSKHAHKSHTTPRHVRAEVDESSDTEDGESAEDDHEEKRKESGNMNLNFIKYIDLPAEYYQIQKLVRYLRCGNETATVIAICALRDFDLSQGKREY